MLALCTAKHESTGFSPNRLMFRLENRTPLDLLIGDIPGENQTCDNYTDFVSERQQRIKDCYAIVREHLGNAAKRRKNDYDLKVHSRTFKVGDWVWYYTPSRYVHRTPKWCKMYTGPYLFTKVIEPNDYVIQWTQRSAALVVHSDKLKLCHGPTPRSWLPSASQVDQQDVTADIQPESDQNDAGNNQVVQMATQNSLPRKIRQPSTDVASFDDGLESQRILPRRSRVTPARFRDF